MNKNSKINLVIPCAGKSKRFFDAGYKKHKAFLELDKEFNVISRILNGFDNNVFDYHLIFTSSQIKKYKNEINSLHQKLKNIQIHEIDEHELGPTFSVSKIKVVDSKPILIHYCDFETSFDKAKLINYLKNGYIVAPYFRGFHPASLGTTNFAYMIVDAIEEMQNLQEKKSFTENRVLEPASTGIYGFPSFQNFMRLKNNLFNKKQDWDLPEAYTSLLLNEAIEQNMIVKCIEVEKFICFGTPRDYKEYIYWSNLYKKFKLDINKSFLEKNKITHLITAAGRGSRFIKESYKLPKIFNKFNGIELWKLAKNSLNGAQLYILVLEEMKKIFKKKILSKEKIEVFYINETTKGQLISLKKLVQKANFRNQFFVSSADYQFQIDLTKFEEFKNIFDPDIVIFTIEWLDYAHSEVNNYGFLHSENNQITEIIEKPQKVIDEEFLNNLVIGTFWFKNKEIIYDLPLIPNCENGEMYIATSIGKSLSKYKVFNFKVEYWLSLGTPKELNLAKYWFDYFANF